MESFDKAVRYFKEGEFDQALEMINICLASSGENAGLYSFRARVLSRMGRLEDSLKDFNYLIGIEPYNANYIGDRAVVLHLLNQHEKALSELDRALNLDSKNPYRFSSRAFLKERLGDLKGAIADYERAIDLDPEDAVAYNNKGLVEEQLGYRDKSKQSFNNADELVGYRRQDNDQVESKQDLNGKPDQTESSTFINKEIPKATKLSIRKFIETLGRVFRDKQTRQEFFSFVASKLRRNTP